MDNSDKNINFTKKITKDEIRNVISGIREIRHGANIQAIADYLRKSERTSSLVKGAKQFKKQEESLLIKYISDNKLWTNPPLTDYIDEGAEQKVYLFGSSHVIKLNDGIFYDSWQGYLTSLLLHNYFFPATSYELIGFTKQDNTIFSIVKQDYIDATEITDLNKVKKFMIENGFINTKNNDYYNKDLGIILEDLHENNVLTENGIFQFIDTVFYMKEKLEKGGSIQEREELYSKWKEKVNMSKSELEKFYNSKEGKEAGLSISEAKELGIGSGRESARWIMKMKDTPIYQWTPEMISWANRQINFINRMSGVKGKLYDKDGNPTRKLTALKIWGHDPEKFEDGGNISAKEAAEQLFNSLTPEELEKIKERFKQLYSQQLIENEEKLKGLELEKTVLNSEKEENYNKEKATEDYAEKSNLSKRRMDVHSRIKELDVLIRHQNNILKALKNNGSISVVEDKKEYKHDDVPNFREIDTTNIAFDEETILAEPIPPYIPEINEDVFRQKGYVFDAIRVNKDTYLLSVNGYKESTGSKFNYSTGKEEGGRFPSDAEQGFVLVTLDQLVLINDYYFKKAKALNQKEADDANKRAEAHYDSLPYEKRATFFAKSVHYQHISAAAKKKVSKEQWDKMSLEEKEKIYKPIKHYGAKRLSSKLDEDQMWLGFADMYRRFLNPAALPPKKGYEGAEVFGYWRDFRDMMKWKIKDIEIQRQTDSEVRKIALETSFGESNTNDSLKEEFGILVKRQDGSKINPAEIEQIKGGWQLIVNTFGDLKNQALASNLKISHTGKKYVFASKAAGMFIPDMGTIAVSDKFGADQFNSTLAHEVAHYIDSILGALNGKRHATDNFEDSAGMIARMFRKNMNAVSTSNYVNATCECFARAMEQYFAITNFGDDATLIFSNVDLGTIRTYFHENSYVGKDFFYNQLKPAIEAFLEENASFLNLKQLKPTKIEIKPLTSLQKSSTFVANMEAIQDKINKLQAGIESDSTPEPVKEVMRKSLTKHVALLETEKKTLSSAESIVQQVVAQINAEKYFARTNVGGTANFKLDKISDDGKQIFVSINGESPTTDKDDEKEIKKLALGLSEIKPLSINGNTITLDSTIPKVEGNNVTATLTVNLNNSIK